MRDGRKTYQSDTAESEVSPLIARFDQSTDQTRDDHDLIDENDVENGGPGKGGGEEQVHEQQWSGDDPRTESASSKKVASWKAVIHQSM